MYNLNPFCWVYEISIYGLPNSVSTPGKLLRKMLFSRAFFKGRQ